jgi:Protein of unknown function (DUF3107)
VTAVRFSGGEVIEVNLSLEEVRKLLQKALAQGALLELKAQDGDTIVINPQQVQYLQNGSGEPFPGPAVEQEAEAESLSAPA